MQQVLQIDNYIIQEPLVKILVNIKQRLTNGKLKDITVSSKGIKISCPFHNNGLELNPDCHINITNSDVPYGYFHCFACDEKGSFIKLVAGCFDSTEAFAKSYLISNYGIKLTDFVEIDDEIILPNKKSKQVNLLLEQDLAKYQNWCPYLEKRKLSREVCEYFNVKYDSYYRQVVFPVYDSNNTLKMLAKRNIDTKMFNMTANTEKEVYGLNVINNNNIDCCLLTEGPIDALTCWSQQIPAIATLGSVDRDQIEKINKSKIKYLFIATDNDKAGNNFAEYISKYLDSRIITERVQLPKNRKDVNDLNNDEWTNLIENYKFPKKCVRNLLYNIVGKN